MCEIQHTSSSDFQRAATGAYTIHVRKQNNQAQNKDTVGESVEAIRKEGCGYQVVMACHCRKSRSCRHGSRDTYRFTDTENEQRQQGACGGVGIPSNTTNHFCACSGSSSSSATVDSRHPRRCRVTMHETICMLNPIRTALPLPLCLLATTAATPPIEPLLNLQD